jgi:putative MATE family efflux protein
VSVMLRILIVSTLIWSNEAYTISSLRVRLRRDIIRSHCASTSISSSIGAEEEDYTNPSILKRLHAKIDKEMFNVAIPAFVSLAADPLASLVDSMYVGRLGTMDQAGMGIAISSQFSVAKLYNDPLLKTSTSLVAGKEGDELSASVSSAMLTAVIIGCMQFFIFFFFSPLVLTVMGVPAQSPMRIPAVDYLKWRALGIPAQTVLLVSNGIFRGRGDTKTPLFCTSIGNVVNILLDPIFIFNYKMGCSGAGAATAISQWVTAIPLIYFLNKSIPFTMLLKGGGLQKAAQSYFKAGGLILMRTIAKISAYAVTAACAARLGPVTMAAYSLTFNLGFATSQLCESVSIAAQALLARDVPFNTPRKKASAAHIIFRALQAGFLVSGALSLFTLYNQDKILQQLSKSPEVQAAAAAIMPVVLVTQLVKGLAYSTGGILLGGLDWSTSSSGMALSSVICILLVKLLPATLWNIWVALAAFMATQVIHAATRFLTGQGPWVGLGLIKPRSNIADESSERLAVL